MQGSSIVLYCLLCILTDILRCLKLYLLLVSKLCFTDTFLSSLIFMCLLCAYIWFLMLMDMYIFIHENNWFYQMISLKSVSLSLFLQTISIDPENIHENTEVPTTGNFRESYYEELSDSENIYHNHELITTD